MRHKIDRDSVVVVTGASGGIGRAAATAFGRRGAAVALLARGESGLDGAVTAVESAGGRALPISVDMADQVRVEKAAQRVEDELGPIDVWVNVAFSSVFAAFWDIEPEEFERATQVTYLGYVNGTRAALKRMRPRDRGVVVQCGSALAHRGIPLQSAYCGAKHAVKGLHDSLRCELLHEGSGVKTTMVQMPAVNTPQFDWLLNRLSRDAASGHDYGGHGRFDDTAHAASAQLWATRHKHLLGVAAAGAGAGAAVGAAKLLRR